MTVRFGHAAALADVSLECRGGAVTAVVGPNGAGKSSLLLAAYGSVPSSGTVSIDGEDVSRLSAAKRARLGLAIVPQGRQLFPHLTVRENLRVMLEVLNLPRSAMDDALDRFPILRTRARSLAGVLSGGEQQMLAVSRALMASPRILLLDEMMTGLSPRIVQSLAETVFSLSRDGVAVVVAEPSIYALQNVIDLGYVLVRGRIVWHGEGGGAAVSAAYQSAVLQLEGGERRV